jgi:hypothetical protein
MTTVGTCGCIFPEFNQPARRGEVTPHPKKTITIEVTELTEKTGFPDQLSGNCQAGLQLLGVGSPDAYEGFLSASGRD